MEVGRRGFLKGLLGVGVAAVVAPLLPQAGLWVPPEPELVELPRKLWALDQSMLGPRLVVPSDPLWLGPVIKVDQWEVNRYAVDPGGFGWEYKTPRRQRATGKFSGVWGSLGTFNQGLRAMMEASVGREEVVVLGPNGLVAHGYIGDTCQTVPGGGFSFEMELTELGVNMRGGGRLEWVRGAGHRDLGDLAAGRHHGGQ